MNLGKLGADDPVKIGEVTLVPIWEFHSSSMVRGDGGSFVGMKRAKAVVALGPRGALALDLDGEVLSLEELLDEVPRLRGMVTGAGRYGAAEKG
ncbi:hypothetical protein [Candidatus Methanocrinis natronophilus]|uniref:Uncharacterized protein n=1 Tax=Candidatus Methanocrinis natronophilus TaxID=3033396 RepID=A0ABT5XB61_9EURY|nr:hypothetical protein [Candidatus Methanocrinis natronophilus]MDF0591923.1 hypothetical protein [Candidatus Methanocrinis natronophilus]